MAALAGSRRALWLYRAHRVLQKLSRGRASLHAYLFCAQPLQATALIRVRHDPQTRVVPVGPGDALLTQFPRPPAVLADRFARGAACHAVLVKGQFAGHIWLAPKGYDEDEVRCRYVLPNASTVWDFDVYIAPAFRGNRAMARLWKGVALAATASGVDWSYSRISLFNAASVQAHERLGAQHLCSGAFLTLGGWQAALFTGPWRLHLSRAVGAPPMLQLPLPKENAATDTGPAAMVLGLDSHGLAVARALADAGVTVYALEQNLSLPGVHTNRVRRVFTVQSFAAEHLIPALLEARQALAKHSQMALLAVNDRHVAKIAAHLSQLQPAYCIAWAEKASQLVKLQNKIALQAVCEQQGLLYPRSVTFTDAQDHAMAAGLRYPLILKPSRPLSSFKTLLAQDAHELAAQLQAHAHDLPILCQEYVAGDDRQIYFGALMLNRGQVVGALAGRKIESYPPARGQTTIAETVDAPEVLQLTEQFFAGLELTGPVSLELKRDPEGRYWVIEPTVGRTDFWAELCISAGFNQPFAEFRLALGLNPQPQTTPVQTLWFDSERDPLAYPAQCWSGRSLRPMGAKLAFPYFGHGDWRPFFYGLWHLAHSALERQLARLRAGQVSNPKKDGQR